MKIKTKIMDYDKVLALKKEKHKNPVKPIKPLRFLMKKISDGDLKKVNFTYTETGMDALSEDEPCLILMNHSSFIDLEIAEGIWYPKPLQIVCTSDGFVGKPGIMRAIGCIPTQKFVSDMVLIKNMKYALDKLKSSVLMYPEASYSFDGTATPLPESLGKLIKLLKVPVVMIKTDGAFLRDPLYNMLQLRKVDVSAEVKYLLSPDKAQSMTNDEINALLREEFSFDYFESQQKKGIKVSEDFRADGLNRVLYKCPGCGEEGEMVGKGTEIFCKKCGEKYELDEYGKLVSKEGSSRFTHIPDWFRWERECVRKELEEGLYRLETAVDICMMVNRKCIYKVGEGILTHTREGFSLEGCNGRLHYTQTPQASYSLYSDYFWYELGDMICVGDMKTSYYCFPKGVKDIVAKTRLAQEELYKLDRKERGLQ